MRIHNSHVTDLYIYIYMNGLWEHRERERVSIEKSGSSYSTILHVNIVHRGDLLIKFEYT